MASKKKSAIQARQGHPTGIIDDVARPIIQKAARAVVDKTLPRSNSKIANKAYYAARDIEKKVADKRVASYLKKEESLYQKELQAFMGNKKASAKKVRSSAKKRNVLIAKADAVENSGYWSSPRIEAKHMRLANKKNDKMAKAFQKRSKNK
jgi:hypothetical protein